MEQLEKRVSWLELFYDLAFVALIAQLTYTVAEYHYTLEQLFLVGIVGYMIFIAWTGTMINRNFRNTETTKDRLLIQLQMIFAFMMSVTLSGVFHGELWPFLLSFVGIRALQIKMLRQDYLENPENAPKTWNVWWGMISAAVFWAAAGLVPIPYAYIVLVMALAVDILTPVTRGEGNKIRLLNISHLQERMGLFLILVIGESMLVVALANTIAESVMAQPVIFLSGILLMIALWWTYFDHLEKCGEGRRPSNIYIYFHAHALLFGGVVLLAAAYKNFLKHDHLYHTDMFLLTTGVLITVCMLVIIRSTIMHQALLRSGAVRIMAVGIPLIGYAGYTTGETIKAVVLMSGWVMLLAFIDVWVRAKLESEHNR